MNFVLLFIHFEIKNIKPNAMVNWFNKWRVKLNGNKSRDTTFTLRNKIPPENLINNTPIPTETNSNYVVFDSGQTFNVQSPRTHTTQISINQRLRLPRNASNRFKYGKTILHSKLITSLL